MPADPVRLQKAMADAGVASRRKSEQLIAAGRVRVNGEVIREMGVRVRPDVDRIEVDGQAIRHKAKPSYYLLYKPRGVLSAASDRRGRTVVTDLAPTKDRLYPVGRLDLDSEGLILLTNDGDLAERLMHPRYGHDKVYMVLVRGRLSDKSIQRLHDGILLEGDQDPVTADVRVPPANWRWRGEEKPRGAFWIRMTLHEGHKRQIRHMLSEVGHSVERLVRIRQGQLRLGDLEVGKGRWLRRQEITALRRSVGLG